MFHYLSVGILKSKAKPCIIDGTFPKIDRHQKIGTPSIHPVNFSSANLPCAQLSISLDPMSLELPRALLVQLCLLHTKVQQYLAISTEGMPESLTPQIRTEYHTNMLEAMYLYKCRLVEIETQFVTSVVMLCQLLQTCENDSTAQRVTHQGDWPISHQRTHY